MTQTSIPSSDPHGDGVETAELWDEQRERWRRGERPPVEDFLGRLPSGPPPSAIMDLIYSEYVLRLELGETPTAQEYANRFPHLADLIRRQFAVDDALTASADASSTLLPGGMGMSGGSNLAVTIPVPFVAEPPRSDLTLIGRYRIIGLLHAGGKEHVYRALHPTLERDVVLKIGSDAPNDRARLQQEGRILAALDHPNLAKVYDLDFHEGRPFLVMEFIQGRTLEQYAHQQPPTPRRAAALVAAVARGLAAAHRRGVIHRDVKPLNIIVDDGGRPRLIDFGLARRGDAWQESPPEPGALAGTLTYMAPEQARAEVAQIGPRSDVFALGGVLYFLLTGKPPFDGRNFVDVLRRAAINDWDRASLAKAPQALRAVCLRAMATDPAARYATADALAADLETYLRRPFVLALAGGVAAVTLLIALALWLGLGGRSPSTNVPTNPTSESTKGPALGVRVWSGDRYRDIANCLPLNERDEVQLQAKVPQGSYAALFVFGTDKQLRLLTSVTAEDRNRSLQYPQDENQAAPLEPPAGTELVFVVTRRSGPVDENTVRELWDTQTALPTLPDGSLLAMRSDKVEVVVASRSIGEPQLRSDPEGEVRRRLEKLRGRLRERFDSVEGLAFAHP